MQFKIKFPLFAIVFLSSFALAPSSFAHGHGECKADREKFCASVKGEEGLKCLQDHQKDLQPECQAKLGKMKEHFEAFKKDCGDDVKKLCPNAEHGKATKACLRENETKLSSTCQARISKKGRDSAAPAPAPATK